MVHLVLVAEFSHLVLPASEPGLPEFEASCLTGQEADAHLWLTEGGQTTGRCSLWWQKTPSLEGLPLGYIGHYAASDEASGQALLERACACLQERGCRRAVGPMDGNTWRRYRFVTDRGIEPPFFMEPQNPASWPLHWTACGFTPLAEYYSALNTGLSKIDPRIARTESRLRESGITIRPLRADQFLEELRRVYAVSAISFQSNYLYTPLEEADFIAQYRQIEKRIDPRLVLLAEREGEPVGYIFAIPDLAQAQRGEAIDTVIIKTVAVLPGRAQAGLGAVLLEKIHHTAHALGYKRAIHALMHETNKSRNLSDHSARTMRRYTLFAKRLGS